MVLVFTYGAFYGALSMAFNPPLDSLGTLWDAYSKRPSLVPEASADVVPQVGDLPITLVNDVFLRRRGDGAKRNKDS